jgi:hypothetical protein
MIAYHRCKRCGFAVPFEVRAFESENPKQTFDVVKQMLDHMKDCSTLEMPMEEIWTAVDEVAQA